jgi:hypothetical protein
LVCNSVIVLSIGAASKSNYDGINRSYTSRDAYATNQ